MEEWAVEEWKAVQFKEDMMDIDTIRYFGAAYVMESNLPPKEKCNLIDYIKEAEWDQILNLVFNGDPPSRKLTVNEQYILEAQAENFIYPLILKYMTEVKRNKKSNREKRREYKSGQSVTAKQKGMTYKERMAKAKEKLAAKAKVQPSKKVTIVKVSKDAAKKLRTTAEKTKDTAKVAADAAGDAVKAAPQKAVPFTTQVNQDAGQVWTSTKETVRKGGVKAREVGRKASPFLKKAGKGGSIILLIAAATAAGHRIYRIFVEKAARQCKGLKGPERRSCIVRLRKAGYQAKINSYIKAKNDCRGTKDPARCVRHIDDKIKRVKYKMGTLYSRL